MNARLGLILVVLVLAGAAGVPRAALPDAPPTNPVARDVLRMHENGVSQASMIEWLRRARPRVGALAPDDLIALAKANVPEPVVAELVSLSDSGVAGPASALPEREAPGTTPAAAPGPPDAPVRFSLAYRPDTAPGDDPWDLCVYLDGRLLGCLPGGGSGPSRRTAEFERPLAPGEHAVRVALERHSASRSRPPNEARVNPDPLPFTLAAGLPAKVGIQFDDGSLDLAGSPLRWSVEQGDEVLVPPQRAGGKVGRWRRVCEEIELDVGPKGPTGSQRRALADCVRWGSLWRELRDLPPRDAVRPAASSPSK